MAKDEKIPFNNQQIKSNPGSDCLLNFESNNSIVNGDYEKYRTVFNEINTLQFNNFSEEEFCH